MISVIICSGNARQLDAVQRNIAETIGVLHEIIAIDNTGGKRGICEIYNEGMHRARHTILCFMHEDVILHTPGWGNKVLELFRNDAALGLIGIAGSTYKALVPSGWNASAPGEERSNLIQAYKFTRREPHLHYRNPHNVQLAEVAAIDGVWFCAPKAVALQHPFDAATFKGFHAYDVDFSLSIGTAYKVGVTYEVLLTHLSEGNYNQAWLRDILALHKKWQLRLPVNKGKLSGGKASYIEKITFRQFVAFLETMEMPVRLALKWLWQSPLAGRLGITLFTKLNFYLIKKMMSGKAPL